MYSLNLIKHIVIMLRYEQEHELKHTQTNSNDNLYAADGFLQHLIGQY